MANFVLSTDSTCDLYHDFVVEHDIKFAPLTFTVEKDGVMTDYLDEFTQYSQYVDFYNQLRGGALSKTSMLNYESHLNHFMRLAKEGAEDVVHFTISSGLARTREVAAEAAAEVKKQYPKFQVYVVDPLSATVGQGMLVRLALKCRDEGKTAKETADYVNSLRLNLQHYIVADDLNYLKRGGRISPAVAAIGGVLNIKPILSFNKEGKLDSIAKVRGIKKAISFIEERAVLDPPSDLHLGCIVHTDNNPCANEIKEFVMKKFGFEPLMQIMGPVIGSHVGPNAFAFAYFSNNLRNEIETH